VSLTEFKRGRAATVDVPPGFLFRESHRLKARASAAREPVDLEQSPAPDYDDYFRALHDCASLVDDPTAQWLPVEASRGCWWGEKVHCTFCGLNGDTMRFRAKSARRVVEETDELVTRYAVRRLQFADNILDPAYIDDLMPVWAARGDATERFFEIKSNLTRDQLALIRRAGVTTVQAGIESLSDATLRVMGKGVSGAQNIALLRWCAELGIDPLWNIIYAFPKERLEDYPAMLDVLRQLVHLPPPDAAAPIRMDRFSPNFTEWREHGFTAVAPMPAYRHVFPFAPDDLGTAAYYFRYEHPQFDDALREGAEIEQFIWEWHQKHQQGEAGGLVVERRCEGFAVVDTRFTKDPASWELDLSQLAVLMACDRPISAATAMRRAAQWAGDGATVEELETALSHLVDRQLIAHVGNALVTLACLPADVRESRAWISHDRVSWPVVLRVSAPPR
jgi:ribosomal peptide maturation radical SAM protein 1